MANRRSKCWLRLAHRSEQTLLAVANSWLRRWMGVPYQVVPCLYEHPQSALSMPTNLPLVSISLKYCYYVREWCLSLSSTFNGLTGSWLLVVSSSCYVVFKWLIEELWSFNLINIFQGFHLTTTTVSREKVLVQLWLSLTSSRGPPILLALQPTQAAAELHQVSIQSHILAKLL